MNCSEFKERVHESFRETMPTAERDAIARHAEGCPACHTFMADCRQLSCREFIDFLHAYIDQELPPERVAVFDRHLALCPDCTSYLDSYRKTVDLSVAALSELTSREIPEDLVRAILEARRKS